jgi:Na+-driven multidrug efflux pump
LNIFFGTRINAAQGIAGQISGQLGGFALILSKALNPLIDKSEGSGDRKKMIRATLTGSKLSFFCGVSCTYLF